MTYVLVFGNLPQFVYIIKAAVDFLVDLRAGARGHLASDRPPHQTGS